VFMGFDFRSFFGSKDDAIASVNGIDVSSISEAMKQHNLILVEAHAKLVQELKVWFVLFGGVFVFNNLSVARSWKRRMTTPLQVI